MDVPHWLEFGAASDGSYEDLLAGASDAEPAGSERIGGDDPLLILYTGGTTGESKGALHSHRSIYMGMLNQTVAERIVPSDVYMLTGQMFHIPVGLAMNYMAHGCPLVLVNFEARQALELIQEEKVSAFLGITTMLNWMMAVENFACYDLGSLRNIQYGGGPMPVTVIKAALDMFPCTLIQGYGQTEGMTMTFLSQEDHAGAMRGERPERLRSCGREGFVTSVRGRRPRWHGRWRAMRRRRARSWCARKPTWWATGAGPTSRRRPSATAGCGPATSRPGTSRATSSSSIAPRT